MIGELDRRLANIVRVGTVYALQESPPRVQVDLGDLVTDWLPWAAVRSGDDADWSAYEPGEQVIVLAPSGELASAVVWGAIPQDAHPAPGTSKDHTRRKWKDGAFEDYDRAGHHYVLDIPDAGDLTLHVGAATLKLKNSDITATIGSTTLKLEGGKATLTTNELDVNAATSKFSGDITAQGTITGSAVKTASGIDLGSHRHLLVKAGTDTSGPPG